MKKFMAVLELKPRVPPEDMQPFAEEETLKFKEILIQNGKNARF